MVAKPPDPARVLAALRAQDPEAYPGADPPAALAAAVAAAVRGGRPVEPAALRLAVRHLAQALARQAPGRTVELRVPPYVAVQCVAGPRHTRGTPPNVVEIEPVAFVALCAGDLTWAQATRDGRVRASGERSAAVGAQLPLL